MYNNFSSNNNRHKVFISYHHDKDQDDKDKFLKLFGSQGSDILVDYSVDTGDIDENLKTETIRTKIRDEYIREATVIIVLIGKETWKRKHVDWEIYSGLRDTKNNPRCGLLGIFLYSYPLNNNKFNHCTIPPRLYDNWNKDNFYNSERYAELYNWSEDPKKVSNWIQKAFKNRDKIKPNNSRDMFRKNKTSDNWC